MGGITKEVAREAGELIAALLDMYQGRLDKAYLKSDGALSVDLKARFKPSDSGDMQIDASINFVTDRIKDNFTRLVYAGQGNLFIPKPPQQCAWPTIPRSWWPPMPDCRVRA